MSSPSHWAYLILLTACVVGTAPLEIWLHTGVYAQWRRLTLRPRPRALVFGGWDMVAVARGDWSFNREYVLGVILPGGLPLEEVLFFLVIPVCAILTLEAVRACRPDWVIGDEAGPAEGAPGE